MKNKELLAELKAYSDSLRQKVEAKFEGWDDSLSAISERRKKVLDPVSGYDFFVSNYFPHYVRSSSRSQLHNYLLSICTSVTTAIISAFSYCRATW